MKVLTVFIDGLKPESIKYMPFIRTLNQRRITTELGYSNSCHASMYSGVYPNKHLIWFIWKYAPNTSPFRWVNKIKLDSFPDNIFIKYLFYRITNLFYKNSSAFGLPFLWYMPLNKWHYFDVSESKFWDESHYLDRYPTIFEILRFNKIDYEIVGLKKGELNRSSEVVKNYDFRKLASWTYLFIGDIDPLSHEYGQDSQKVREKLEEIDKILENIYNQHFDNSENFCFILFSDHGHTIVSGKVNLNSIFNSQNKNLCDYIYFVDANYARFWFRNAIERKEVIDVLSIINDKGFILSKNYLERYKINMPDNRYGDLVFYLNAPYIFDQGSIFIMGKERSDTGKYISFHGFLPDYPNSDGVFVSNKDLINDNIKLEDVVPSILNLFNLDVPNYIDGKIIWG